MPYDPRSVSKGGNRGVDEVFSRSAPKGKYRIICVDTFDGGDWVHDDVDTLQEAQDYIKEKSGAQMLKVHVYDDTGKHVSGGGNF